MSAKLDRALRDKVIVVKMKTLTGEKDLQLVPLKRKDAAEVFHTTLITLVSTVAEISKTRSDDDRTFALFKAVEQVEFSKIWGLADKLLANAIIDGVEIKSMDETDYFEQNPLDLYVAVTYAIIENWPDFFGKLRQGISDLDLSEKVKGLGL
jgi:hypothetical protein